MTSTATNTARMSPATRVFYAVPLIGWVARDIAKGVENIYYALVIALTVVVLAVQAWGLPALVITALCLLPLMFAFFIYISLP